VLQSRLFYRLAVFVFALGAAQALGLLALELARIKGYREAIRELELENARLWTRARELEAELAATRRPGFFEGLARQMGLVGKDETLRAR